MKLPIIVGPTCVGKTELAVALKERIPLRVISSDSRQIYKYLTVGTNKPQGRWGQRNSETVFLYKDVIFYLVDFLEPNEEYDAFKFYEDATNIIKETIKKNEIPLVVGGTGLYIKTLTDGISILPKKDPQIRNYLENLAELYGRSYLYEMLKRLDPQRAQEIHPNNLQRILRSLEIIYKTGKPYSILIKEAPKVKSYDVVMVGLYLDKNSLKERIVKRTEWMFNNGLIEETKEVLKKYGKDVRGFSSIGYGWVINYIKGSVDLETAKKNFIKDTLDYAKRQMTWFKKDKRIIWIDCDNLDFKKCINLAYKIFCKHIWKK